ncbi:hypothetical protein K7432_017047, partial [Basidiobolus ranarum]
CIYPLLFYTIRVYKKPEGLSGFIREPKNTGSNTNPPYEIFFDLGAYGIPPAVKANKPWDAVEAVRKMEKYTRDVGGYQMMYADNFMNREEFEQMFDHTLYRQVRAKYNAVGAFPEFWDKVKGGQW